MKKGIRIIKPLLAVVLTLSVLFGNIGILAPKLTASAAEAGQYYIKAEFDIADPAGDFLGSFDNSTIKLYGRANNGVDTTVSVIETVTTA